MHLAALFALSVNHDLCCMVTLCRGHMLILPVDPKGSPPHCIASHLETRPTFAINNDCMEHAPISASPATLISSWLIGIDRQ